MEVNKEKHISQAEIKPIMETDVEKPKDPETEDGNTNNNLNPPHNPAPHKEPCDQTTRKHETLVESAAQLTNSVRPAPDRPGPMDREVRPDMEQEERSSTTHEGGANLGGVQEGTDPGRPGV